MKIAIVAAMMILISASAPLFTQARNADTVTVAGIPVPQEILDRCSRYFTIEYSDSGPTLIFPEKDDPKAICAKLAKDKPPVFQPPKWVEKTIDWGKRHHPALQIGCFRSQDISFSPSPLSGSIMMVCKF